MDVVALFDTFLERFRDMFSKPQFENFEAYIKGLLTIEKKRTINKIAKLKGFEKNQSSLNRFITEGRLPAHKLRLKVRKLLKNKLNFKETVYGIIDDTITEKTGEKMQGASFHYSESKNGLVYGHNFVSLLVKQNNFVAPADIRLYVKEEMAKKEKIPFKTKIELAKNMFSCFPFKPKKTILLGDSWYTCEEIIDSADKKGFTFIGRLKANRILHINGEKFSADKLYRLKSKEKGRKIKIKDTEYEIYSAATAELENGRKVRITFSKRLIDEEYAILVSNNLKLSSEEMVRHYSIRVETEEFYRDAKQNLGLGDYQLRIRSGVLIHGLLTMTAYALLALVKSSSLLSKFLLERLKTIGDVLSFFKKGLEERLAQSVYDLALKGLKLKEIFIRVGIRKNAKL